MKKNLSDCQLPPAGVEVKGDYVGGYLLVGSAKTVHDYEGAAGNRGALLAFIPIWKPGIEKASEALG